MDYRACPHCQKSFKGISGLKIHLRKAYPCNSLRHDLMSEPCTEDIPGTRLASITLPQQSPPHSGYHGVIPNGFQEDLQVTESSGVLQGGFEEAGDIEVMGVLSDGESEDDGLPSLSSTTSRTSDLPSSHGKTFSSTLLIAHALLSCRNGQGLSKEDTNRFLDAINDPRFDSRDVKIKSFEDLQKICRKLENSLLGEESSKEATVNGYTKDIACNIVYKDSAEALKLILRENFNDEDFVKNSTLIRDERGQRVYSGPETGDWWIDIESRLRIDTREKEAVVLGVILYSDSTTVTQNGRDSMWPIYMTLANIPMHKRNLPGAFQLLGFIPDTDGMIQLFDDTLSVADVIALMNPDKIEALDSNTVFSNTLETILKPLKDLSHSGLRYCDVMAYPLFYCYVHDQPEGGKVTGIYGSGATKYPCTKCLVKQEDNSSIAKSFKYRTENYMKKVNEEIRTAMVTEKATAKKLCSLCPMYSAYGVDCALWGFRYSNTDIGNIFQGLLVETLHQTDQGVFKRMIMELRHALKTETLTLLDERMTKLLHVGFVQQLRIPTHKTVWQSGISLQANEYRTIMQVAPIVLRGVINKEVVNCFILMWEWYKFAARRKEHTDKSLNKMETTGRTLVKELKLHLSRPNFNWSLNKIHAIAHYKADIKRSGSTHHYNAEMYENLHQKVIKQPHRVGNKRKKESFNFIMRKHERSYVVDVIKRYIDVVGPQSRESNSDIADKNGCNVLPYTFTPLKVECLDGVEGFLDHLQDSLADFCLKENITEKPKKVNWFTSCAIGRSSDGEGSPETWTAFANPNHYGIPKYSCVAVQGSEYGREKTWYAKILAFLSFEVLGRNSKCEVAFVKYFKQIAIDDVTKCPKLQWEVSSKRWGLLDIQTILRVVHIVELYNEAGTSSIEYFLLNKYLWRDISPYAD